jgi:hypothetical protein
VAAGVVGQLAPAPRPPRGPIEGVPPMPVEGQVHGPAPAGEPFVCVAGCKGPAGLHPRGTMRYGIFQPGRRDPRAHVDCAQPWA